jgi:hypothetical protein
VARGEGGVGDAPRAGVCVVAAVVNLARHASASGPSSVTVTCAPTPLTHTEPHPAANSAISFWLARCETRRMAEGPRGPRLTVRQPFRQLGGLDGSLVFDDLETGIVALRVCEHRNWANPYHAD